VAPGGVIAAPTGNYEAPNYAPATVLKTRSNVSSRVQSASFRGSSSLARHKVVSDELRQRTAASQHVQAWRTRIRLVDRDPLS